VRNHLHSPRLPWTYLRPDGSVHDFSNLNAQVRIIATLSSTSPIQLSRLSPQRSNIRIKDSNNSEAATPIYNSILLMHATARSYILKMHMLQKNVPAFGDALALLKVWANQRGYGESSVESREDEGHSSLRSSKWTIQGFEGMGVWWVAVLDYIVYGGETVGKTKEKRRPLGHSLSSYQLFRAVLDFFCG
jgi:U3 small nucleolar RNA-associated protein 22